jgi:hypothetical protein
MARKFILKNAPPEKLAELERLQAQVAHAEGHDQHDTVHHELLTRLQAELGLIPARKIEDQKDEVNDGKQDI